MALTDVKQTERGWAGHFILSDRCGFRRNTLLECGGKRIIISTVGDLRDLSGKLDTVGNDRYYETMAFVAVKKGEYWDADVMNIVNFDSKSAITKADLDQFGQSIDNVANDMHENVVTEIAISMS